jgi:hypothetical protein
MHAWYYWAYIAKAINRRKPWTLQAGTLRRSLADPLADLLLRGDIQLAKLGMRITKSKLAGLREAKTDWQAGDPGRALRPSPGNTEK